MRLWNLPVEVFLIVAAFVLDNTAAAAISSALSGAALVGLSLVRGRVDERFGRGWRAILHPERGSRSATRT